MAQLIGPDCDVYMTVTEWPRWGDWDQFGLYARLFITSGGGVFAPNAANTYSGYALLMYENATNQVAVYLRRLTNTGGTGGTTIAAEVLRTVADGDKFGLRCYGSSIKGYHYTAGTWVEILSATDATYTAAGYTGFYMPGNFNDADPTDPGYYDDYGAGGNSGAAFPEASISDAFTRGDATTLGPDWQGFTNFGSSAVKAGINTVRATNTAFSYPSGGFWGYLFGTLAAIPPAPPLPGATRMLFALEHPIPDPPSYEDGYKTGKLRVVGAITQALSNDDGDYVGTSVEVGLDDKDRQTRLILDDPTIKFLDGSEGTFKIVSETRRRARGTPTAVFRGRVKAYGLKKGLTASITIEDVLTSEYGPLSARRLISDRKLTRGLFPGLPPEVAGKPQPIIMGEVGDWGATLPLGQVPPVTTSGALFPVEKGLVPVWAVSTRNINGVDWVEFFLCGHAVSDFDVYAADATNTFRQLVDPSVYGSYVLAPHHVGWPFANHYFDYVDSDTGFTHRCTTFFIRADHIMATSHLAGQITVACNVCGMEDIGDGSGNTITGLFHQWQFLCDNYIFANPGYYSGLYTNVPVWGTNVRMTNSASFAALQAMSAGWIGGEGYTGGFVLYSLLSREVMRRFAITAFANYGWSKAGQFMVSMFDDTLNVVGLPRYTQPIRLRGGIPSEYTGGPLENPIFYNYDYDYDLNKYRMPQGKVDDPVARTFTGYVERPVEVDCFFTRDPATAQHAMARRLLRRKQPLAAVEMPMPLSGLDLELGDVIAITSEDGKGTGFVDATVRATSRTYYPKERRVVCSGVVVDDMLGVLQQWQPNVGAGGFTWQTTGASQWRS